MFAPTVLLTSSDRSLMGSIGDLVGSIDSLRLEVVPTVDLACDRVGREDVSLVVAHLDEDRGVAEATRLLQAIALARPAIAVVVVADGYHAAQALAMLRLGVAD